MSPREDRLLAAVAGACAALVFAVVASSAWLRLAQDAVACAPGACEGFSLADGVRLAHRIAAMGVSVAALLIAWLAWSRRPAAWGLRASAAAMLVLVAFLAALGRSSSGTPTAPVVLGNLLGGLVLLGTSVALAFRTADPPAPGRGARHAPTLFAAALAVAAVLSGAALSVLPREEAQAFLAAHRVAGWTLPVVWAALAARRGLDAFERKAAAATAIAVVVLAATPLLSPLLATTGLGEWVHNVLAAAAMSGAIACAMRSCRRP